MRPAGNRSQKPKTRFSTQNAQRVRPAPQRTTAHHSTAVKGPRKKATIARYQTLMRKAHQLYETSVLPSTRVTYSTGEKMWLTVMAAIGTDPYMRIQNPAWIAGEMIFAGTSITWRETCVLAFLAATREAPRALTPKAAFNYLSAARKFLQNGGVDTTFLENSQYIRNTKASMQIAFRLQTGITDKDTLRLPVSGDMITGHHNAVKGTGNYTILDLAVFTAEILAYTTLSRVSEYLETRARDTVNARGARDTVNARGAHTLRSNDVMFEFSDGAILAAHDVAGRQFAKVVGCLVNIRTAKNDKTGRGHRYYFTKSTPGDQTMYCITWVLWNYAQRARPAEGRSLFYIPALKWTLRPTYLNKRLRAMARMYGLDETRVSSHSLRIGGATALAAAGLHEYEIKQMGGWKSDVFLEYARNTTQMFARARTALARKGATTIQTTKRLHPGWYPHRNATRKAQ